MLNANLGKMVSVPLRDMCSDGRPLKTKKGKRGESHGAAQGKGGAGTCDFPEDLDLTGGDIPRL